MPTQRLKEALQSLIKDIRSGRFKPHNEADVSGYVYHLWLAKHPYDVGKLHLEARVNGYDSNEHADLAYGACAQNDKGRPWVTAPLLVTEAKSFHGFTPAQQNVRKGRLREDIQKLSRQQRRVAKAMFVFDPDEYLQEEDVNKLQAASKRSHVKAFLYRGGELIEWKED